MKLSVVVPHRDRPEALRLTLEELDSQRLSSDSYEVIVVDDGSCADVRQRIVNVETGYQLRFLYCDGAGPGAARNLGAAHAQGESVVFLDCDIVTTPATLAAHLAALDDFPRDIIAGRVEPWQPGIVGVWGWRMDVALGDPRVGAVRDALGGVQYQLLPFYDAWSNNLAMRRSTFVRLGGFHEAFRAFEDVEFGYRACQDGRHIVLASAALGFHNHGRTLRERLSTAENYRRCLVQVLRIHPPLLDMVPALWIHRPISVARDSRQVLLQKVIMRLAASRMILPLITSTLFYADRLNLPVRLVSAVYWRVLAAYQYRGFKAGLKADGVRLD